MDSVLDEIKKYFKDITTVPDLFNINPEKEIQDSTTNLKLTFIVLLIYLMLFVVLIFSGLQALKF